MLTARFLISLYHSINICLNGVDSKSPCPPLRWERSIPPPSPPDTPIGIYHAIHTFPMDSYVGSDYTFLWASISLTMTWLGYFDGTFAHHNVKTFPRRERMDISSTDAFASALSIRINRTARLGSLDPNRWSRCLWASAARARSARSETFGRYFVRKPVRWHS